MSLKIYNTLTRKKELFTPVKEGHAGMYVCGVTVYDECHLGHARAYVSFDVIKRYLEYKGYKVKYVRNVTDVDDKIIDKARKLKKADLVSAAEEVTEKYFGSFKADMSKLNISEPDVEPRATGHIKEIIGIVSSLIDKGYAYALDGDVYYEVAKFKDYGKLSGRSLEDMMAGARVEVNQNKRSAMDFALWKKAKEGEPYWDSPWGKGRPGWHIECSAMSTKYLGQPFDIHGGGQDLIFPHHENEIAQSEACFDKEFVKYWMHNGFVTINSEKMSKSLGNFFALKDIFKKYDGNVVRFFLLTKHYRSPIDFTEEDLVEAKKNIERIENCMGRVRELAGDTGDGSKEGPAGTGAAAEFEAAMDDDFNTAKALAVVFDIVNEINNILDSGKDIDKAKGLIADLRMILNVLGMRYTAVKIEKVLFSQVKEPLDIEGILKEDDVSDAAVKDLIMMRNHARKNKEWKTADAIRDSLLKKGVTLRDEADGTV
ncbi:cysteine--tRNA ligase [Candidatus Auribacterota bacterium]